ncbi:hypothetical protein IQ264_23075 [Phormidium sp. LEGE 05292]|uniref:hypothetical protein n=1 Tax=[Phormidium] sp. LEGE 05292 TaxID=767427 RepID=UPI0018821884|nr:hypothetical protein [Phormidium sp. LEGE 05292]MBE9228310.1 hypothetical protein [Phormidium sp. LEGE 05292]
MSYAIFNESYYLSNYPDVQAAVNARVFSSGLDHFQKAGITEGRTLISPAFDENTYLQKYPDVAAAVKNGVIKSGVQHFILAGEAEGRTGTPAGGPDPINFFNEKSYIINNLDVANAVRLGIYKSGLQHYQIAGQAEGRIGYFTGSNASDVVTAFGPKTEIYGVGVTNVVDDASGETYDIRTTSNGSGEIDTLIGGSGQDEFVLGTGRLSTTSGTAGVQSYYLSSKDSGNDDYALIRNFEKGKDTIVLAGPPSQYILVPNGYRGNLTIYTTSNSNLGRQSDLVAVVEGNPNLAIINPVDANKSGYTLLA